MSKRSFELSLPRRALAEAAVLRTYLQASSFHHFDSLRRLVARACKQSVWSENMSNTRSLSTTNRSRKPSRIGF